MAAIPCSITMDLPSVSSSAKAAPLRSSPISPSSSSIRLSCSFLGARRLGSAGGTSGLRLKVGRGCGGGATCFFRFGSRGMDSQGAGIYGSQSRDDFGRDDVEQYFNYMGMLAVEGTYDKMEALLSKNIHPVDILLLLAATEGDVPKIEELMRAGAKFDVEDADGNTALERAKDEDVRNLILSFAK